MPKPNPEPSKRFEVLLPPSLHERLKAHCARRYVSAADVVRASLVLYFEAEQVPVDAVLVATEALRRVNGD